MLSSGLPCGSRHSALLAQRTNGILAAVDAVLAPCVLALHRLAFGVAA